MTLDDVLTKCAVWGIFATIVLTVLLAGSQGVGLTRMNFPFLLGTVFTKDRDRAKVYGVLLHLLNGILFARLYLAGFDVWGGAAWWKGLVFGGLHAGFLLSVVAPLMPGMHPRMASEAEGPTLVRQLEPPGFLALHYGRNTPISVFTAHIAFGVILGAALTK